MPLTLNGRNVDAQTVLLEPESGRIDVLLEGAPSRLEAVRIQDIQAIVDVSNLPPGDYSIPIRLHLPAFIDYGGEEPLTAQVSIRQQSDAPLTDADPPPEDVPDEDALPTDGGGEDEDGASDESEPQPEPGDATGGDGDRSS